MDRIDIAMTATIRPDLVNRTLSKIVQNVVDNPERFRLIINVDPIGEDINPIKVVNVAKAHFKDVVYNIPKEPSFPKAVRWVWDHTDAPYVFHWEDDAFVVRKINVEDMINILKECKKIASLRLFKANTPNNKSIDVFRSRWHYNPLGFYVADRWQEQFGLNPTLIKKEFVKEAVELMHDDVNPEKQFRPRYEWMVPLISKWKYGLYTKPGEPTLITEGGIAWRNEHGFQKPSKNQFVTWVKKKKKS
jgi:hypothetical protein